MTTTMTRCSRSLPGGVSHGAADTSWRGVRRLSGKILSWFTDLFPVKTYSGNHRLANQWSGQEAGVIAEGNEECELPQTSSIRGGLRDGKLRSHVPPGTIPVISAIVRP